MRRLVVCMDGTWNNPRNLKENDHGFSVYKPSNPLKIYRAVKPLAKGGVNQTSFYDEGVGGGSNTWDTITGGIWGSGFEKNIQDSYRFLAGNYMRGDEIYIFGFSRGAATARSLSRFIDWMGGLLRKSDAYYIPEFFDKYLATRAKEGEVEALRAGRGRRRAMNIEDPHPAKVHFLGVFDTVLARGSRIKAAKGKGTAGTKYQFHCGDRPAPCVVNARQALAIDERRKDFYPEIWVGPGSPNQSLEQRWFPGVHTNVGGGYVNDGLANVALHWMTKEAQAVGLDLNSEFLREYGAWFGDQRYKSQKHVFKLLGSQVRELDVGPEAGLELHDSVIKLVKLASKKQPPYRPENLLQYLAKRPDLQRGLPADVLSEIRRA